MSKAPDIIATSPPVPPKPEGRPSDYTQEKADAICALVAQGCSIRTICKEDGMPDVTTVFRWLRKHEEFRHLYTRAKEEQAHAFAEEMVDICDDGSNDWMAREDKDGNCIGWQVNGEHVQRSRLRVETRKWLAGKMKPHVYGDRATVQTQQLDKDGKPTDPVGPNVYLSAALAAVKKSETNGQ